MEMTVGGKNYAFVRQCKQEGLFGNWSVSGNSSRFFPMENPFNCFADADTYQADNLNPLIAVVSECR